MKSEGDCISLALPRASLQKNRKLASLRFLFCFLQFLLNASILGFAENKNSEAFASLFFAERGGFEPPVPVTQYVSLANWWFQPLTHLSVAKFGAFPISGNAGAKIYIICITQKLFMKIFFTILYW